MSVKKWVWKIANRLRGKKSPRMQLLALMPRQGVCAEIGVWKGGFSRNIIRKTHPKQLHLIDPWAFQAEFSERMFGGKVAKDQNDMDAIYQEVNQDLGLLDEVTIHRSYSSEAAPQFPDHYFDWVYVDGNHYYDYVLQDLYLFAGKIKPGGFLAGDDYLWTSPELNGHQPVKKAVNDFLADRAPEFSLYKKLDSQFILRKQE